MTPPEKVLRAVGVFSRTPVPGGCLRRLAPLSQGCEVRASSESFDTVGAGWFPGVSAASKAACGCISRHERLTRKFEQSFGSKFRVFEKFESNEKILTKITEKALFSGI
jgi:hypothetical protein